MRDLYSCIRPSGWMRIETYTTDDNGTATTSLHPAFGLDED